MEATLYGRAKPDNVSYQTVIVLVISLVLVNVSVLLRLISRKLLRLPLKADDYIIILAALFVDGDAVIYPFSVRYGDGRHINTLSPSDIVNYLKTIYVSAQLYGVAITLVKISVLLFYRRVFSTPKFRRWTSIVGIFVIIWLLVNNLLGAFECRPIRKAWDSELPGSCIHYLTFFIGMQVPNIVLDVVILALPMSAVYQLQLSRGKKISVTAIFLLGGFSVIIAIVRLAILITRINRPDATYSTEIGNWSLVEPAVEVLSACLPTMTPFLNIRMHWEQLRTSFHSTFRSHRSSPERPQSSLRQFRQIPTPDVITAKPWEGKSGFMGKASTIPTIGSPSPDDIHLQSIVVQHDGVWAVDHHKRNDILASSRVEGDAV